MRFVLLALMAVTPMLSAQSLTLVMPTANTPPGSSATVNVQFTNGTTTPPVAITALQFTLVSPVELGPLTIVAGPAAVAAGKSIQCNMPVPGSTGSTGICVLWGLNITPIGDGVVAVITAPVLATAKASSETLGLALALGADANGNGVTTASLGGSFQVFNSCDLDHSGVVDIADVNLVVAQVIASPAACTTGDLNKDSKCNVIDVYRVVVAALPVSSGVVGAGVCKVGP